MADGKERRRYPRVDLRCPLRYRVIPVHEAGYRDALIQDISTGGFRFHTREHLPRQTSFILELHLPGLRPVHSLARASWVKAMPLNDCWEIGGMFVEPTREARAALARFCPTNAEGVLSLRA